MTLEQLRVFVAVAERLHMTRAAEALGLTQPAASASIAALETDVATRLFDRVGRGLALTEAGRLLLPEARAVLARLGQAAQVLDDLAEGFAVRVRSTPTYFVDGVPLSWFADPLMEDYLRKTYLKGAAPPAAGK